MVNSFTDKSIMNEKKALYQLLMLFNGFWINISMVIICLIISAGLSLCVPLISKEIMDEGFLNGNKALLINLVFLLLFIYLLESFLGIIKEKKRIHISSQIQMTLSKQYFSHLMKLQLSYFDNTNYTEVMSNVEFDIAKMSSIFDDNVFLLLPKSSECLVG